MPFMERRCCDPYTDDVRKESAPFECTVTVYYAPKLATCSDTHGPQGHTSRGVATLATLTPCHEAQNASLRGASRWQTPSLVQRQMPREVCLKNTTSCRRVRCRYMNHVPWPSRRSSLAPHTVQGTLEDHHAPAYNLSQRTHCTSTRVQRTYTRPHITRCPRRSAVSTGMIWCTRAREGRSPA